jgi:type I restriction enzyme S subunit
MSNLVPEGWESKQLIECSFNGISNGVFCDPKNVGSGYKLINVYDMYQGYGVNVNLTRRLQLTEKEFLNNKVKYGDVFFTRSSLKLEGIAYCNINLSHDDDITYDGHLMKIRPNTELVNAEYLARYCLSDFARTYFMSTAKHSTMTTIAQADIAPLQVLLPPLPEQQKIAQILTSIDNVIEKTQAQIDKLKDLKTGMMQELLTNGIGHLEFKDSQVGRIPVGWDVVTLSRLVKSDRPITYGIVQTGPNIDEGIPCVRVVDLMTDDISTQKMIRTTKKINDSYKRTVLQSNDIMFALRGSIGHVRMVDFRLVGANLTRGVALISANDLIAGTFLLWAIRCPSVRKVINDGVNGSALQEIPLGNLRGISIPLPTIEEQIQISKTLDSLEENIYQKRLKLKNYQSMKKALMQDLLTGKVRVNAEQSNSSLAVG